MRLAHPEYISLKIYQSPQVHVHFCEFLKDDCCIIVPYILINFVRVNRPNNTLHVGGGLGFIEWMGRVMGVGGKPKAGYTIHWATDSGAVSSVGHRNSHKQHGRLRRSLPAD